MSRVRAIVRFLKTLVDTIVSIIIEKLILNAKSIRIINASDRPVSAITMRNAQQLKRSRRRLPLKNNVEH